MCSWKKEVIKITGFGGTIAGLLGVIMFLVLYMGGVHLFDLSFQLDYWFVALPFIFIGIWYYRKAHGQLRLWQGLVLGYLTNFLAGTVVTIFIFIFLTYFGENFIKESAEFSISHMTGMRDKYISSKTMSAESFDKNLEIMTVALNTTQPIDVALDKLIRFSAIGFIYTFILSLILRK